MAKKQVRIVAYGDSLTEGHSDGSIFDEYPYTDFLKEMINDYLAAAGSQLSVRIYNVARFGGLLVDHVDGQGNPHLGFHNALIDEVLAYRPDLCIVVGGTNNLGLSVPDYKPVKSRESQRELNDIMKNLAAIYTRLREEGAEPISATVPPLLVPSDLFTQEKYEKEKKFCEDVRVEINKRILEYSSQNGITCADLFSALTCGGLSTCEDYKTSPSDHNYHHDWVHFSRRGYERFAEVIFEQGVRPYLDRKLGERNDRIH